MAGKRTIGMLAAGLLIGAAAPAERVITGDAIIPVTVNGVAGHVRVDLAAPGIILLSPDYAARAGLDRGNFEIGYSFGNQRVSVHTKVAELDLGSGPFNHRVGWGARPYAKAAEGTIGPGAMPEPVIRFVLHAPRGRERIVTMPMIDGGGLFGAYFGLFARIDLAGQPMRIRFDRYHPQTIANAGAAVRIATEQGGRMVGETQMTDIAFGISRPVRRMTLARPLTVGPFAIAALGVRTIDFGNATAIPDVDVPAADPDEVVVTAKGKKHNPDRDRLTIGADQLDHCSSIVFDKPERQIRLSCL